MTDHECNILAAKAMGWKGPALFHETDGGYRICCDAKGESFVALVPNTSVVVWSPVTNLSQAWELYTHVHEWYADAEDANNPSLYELATTGAHPQYIWRSPEEFARALVDESLR